MQSEPDPGDPRACAARGWATRLLGLTDDADFAPASADASFRRYFRLRDPRGERSWIIMDAPPEQENCEPFVRIAARLADAGLNVPRVLEQDSAQGFLLLSDLGRQTYLQVLDDGNADALFADAIDALVRMQGTVAVSDLPAYDTALLQRELDLFPDWFVQRHLQLRWTDHQAAKWRQVCAQLIESALAQPQVFVHRDFMPRNLMCSLPNPGLLDFQDAVCGPVTYDVACLFKDAFLSWPQHRIDTWLARYADAARHAGIGLPPDFDRALDWMGLQRHLKVLGIFARIHHRDGKPQYLADAPRFIGYVRAACARHPQMQPLRELFDTLGLQA